MSAAVSLQTYYESYHCDKLVTRWANASIRFQIGVEYFLSFYRTMLRRARCHNMSSVRLSVRLWRSGTLSHRLEFSEENFRAE